MQLDILYNEDCLDGMKRLPDHSIDCILSDLPYGTTQNHWDSVIPLEPLWEQYGRVIRDDGAIVLTAAQPFTSSLVGGRRKWFKYSWVWEKSSVTGHLNAHRRPMRIHEDVLVFSTGSPPYFPQGLEPFGKTKRRGHNGTNFGRSGTENMQAFTGYPRSIVRFANDSQPVHPTQKPVALFEYLIRTYTNEGETVLDNCAGSMTTAVACLNTDRRFICFEKDREYFRKGVQRVHDHALSQGKIDVARALASYGTIDTGKSGYQCGLPLRLTRTA